MAFGYNGYFTQRSTNQVIRWNPDTDESTVVAGGTEDDNPENKLNGPYGLAVDKEGTLYIADKLNHRICKVDKRGKFSAIKTRDISKRRASRFPNRKHSPVTPTGLVVEPSGSLLCSFCDEHTIYRIHPNGDLELVLGIPPGTHYTFKGYIEKIPPQKVKETPIFLPTALAQGPDGAIYFIERGYEAVRRYHPQEGISSVFSGPIDNSRNRLPDTHDEFPLSSYRPTHPSGLAIDNYGNIFLSDSMMGIVVCLNIANKTVQQIIAASEPCHSALPVVIGTEGAVWVLNIQDGKLCGSQKNVSGQWELTMNMQRSKSITNGNMDREWGGLAYGL